MEEHLLEVTTTIVTYKDTTKKRILVAVNAKNHLLGKTPDRDTKGIVKETFSQVEVADIPGSTRSLIMDLLDDVSVSQASPRSCDAASLVSPLGTPHHLDHLPPQDHLTFINPCVSRF